MATVTQSVRWGRGGARGPQPSRGRVLAGFSSDPRMSPEGWVLILLVVAQPAAPASPQHRAALPRVPNAAPRRRSIAGDLGADLTGASRSDRRANRSARPSAQESSVWWPSRVATRRRARDEQPARESQPRGLKKPAALISGDTKVPYIVIRCIYQYGRSATPACWRTDA